MSKEVERRRSGAVRARDLTVLVVVGVAGVLVAFWLLGAIAGFLWGLVKLAVVIAVVVGVLWMLVGRRRTA